MLQGLDLAPTTLTGAREPVTIINPRSWSPPTDLDALATTCVGGAMDLCAKGSQGWLRLRGNREVRFHPSTHVTTI